jgi:3-phosphoshikimate 1-carboxyvinyltransferase
MPGDKSISHRAALIAALAEGTSSIRNFSTSADCSATLSCLEALGVSISRSSQQISISGVGPDGLHEPNAPLDCHNSGTTMRLLAGILAGQDFTSTLTGDDSLRSRPMRRIIEPLQMMGAKISSDGGRPPLVIEGHKRLNAISYELLVASAQVKSCILLAGLSAEGRTEVVENEITRDHTERMLSRFGVQIETGRVEREGKNARFAAVKGPSSLRAQDVSVPGDISSAAYFLAAAALLPGSSLEVMDLGVNPTRVLFLGQLRSLGFDLEVTNVHEEGNESSGVIRIGGSEKRNSSARAESPTVIGGLIIPQLIDELPLLAVVGSQVAGGIEIRDAAELRVKESDRIAATADNLRAMGAEVDEFDDGLRVGEAHLRGAKIDPRGDHRIAMAFTVAGLIAEGDSEIINPECVAVSFPEFFDLLDSVVER